MARRFSPTNYVSSFLDSDRPDYGELGALGVRARFNEEATSRLWDAEVDANLNSMFNVTRDRKSVV